MIDAFLLPVLLSGLISILLCAFWRSRNRRPPLWLALLTPLVLGIAMTLLLLGSPLFTSGFWRDNGASDTPLLGVLYTFGLLGFASLIPSVIVVALYRDRTVTP